MNLKKELDVIQLDNGVELPVVDAISYKNSTYLLVKIYDENKNDYSDISYIYEKKKNEISIIENQQLIEELIKIFKKRNNVN